MLWQPTSINYAHFGTCYSLGVSRFTTLVTGYQTDMNKPVVLTLNHGRITSETKEGAIKRGKVRKNEKVMEQETRVNIGLALPRWRVLKWDLIWILN